MEKFKRSERITIITKYLVERPNYLFSLNHFTELLMAAKSTISEDITIIKDTFISMNLGRVETVSGAAGGIKYLPLISEDEKYKFLEALSLELAKPERVVPGGFIYMGDLIGNAQTVKTIGEIFYTQFSREKPDYIVTIETKGIPIALMVARVFDIPLVIIRDDSKVTEGSSVSINYISGSSKRIQSMALSRRALPEGAKVLIIDDFMKAGGTARGMVDLMAEFGVQVLGIGVLVGTMEPEAKLVENYTPLLELENIDVISREIFIKPVR